MLKATKSVTSRSVSTSAKAPTKPRVNVPARSNPPHVEVKDKRIYAVGIFDKSSGRIVRVAQTRLSLTEATASHRTCNRLLSKVGEFAAILRHPIVLAGVKVTVAADDDEQIEAPRTRSYAIGILVRGQLDSIPQRHLSIAEARGFLRGYNHIQDERVAVILDDPIRLPAVSCRGKAVSA